MKKYIFEAIVITIVIAFVLVLVGAKDNKEYEILPVNYNFSGEFKSYWLNGLAEINSYDLLKARYGEIHKGDAVLLYVVEPFLPQEQVKSDGIKTGEKSERVMKLINSQKFFTGIYPYSIMTSSFYPLNTNRKGLLKLSLSSQDWCGQVFSQINNRDDHFELNKFSYFQKEGDENIKLGKSFLEEEIFTQIRLNPENLPIGEFELYPSSQYLRLTHNELKKYSASAKVIKNADGKNSIYELIYEGIDRELVINFENSPPYKITGWKETYSDFSGKRLSSTASLRKSINLDYWKHNNVSDSTYRIVLGFK